MMSWNLTDLTGLYFVLWLLFLIAGVVLHIFKKQAENNARGHPAKKLQNVIRICLLAACACFVLYLFSFIGSMSDYFSKGH